LLLYGGDERYYGNKINFIPLKEFFNDCQRLFFQGNPGTTVGS
jgi:hypothetical protein